MANTEETGNLPIDPVLRARSVAIRTAGGPSRVAKALGLKNHESVSRWLKTYDPKPEQARVLVQLCGNVVSLAEILPTVYGELSVTELGYSPAQVEGGATA